MRRTLSLILIAAAAGCARTAESDGATEAPTTIPAIAGIPLGDALELLDRELAAALERRLEDDGLLYFARAEALTDRLLETRYPFTWLRASGYSLDAKLRQIQSQADRITAQLRSQLPRDTMVAELQRLRRSVTELREALLQGGGPATPSLERLLAGRDTLNLGTAEGAGGE